MSAKELATQYRESLSDASEPVSDAFVDMSKTIISRMILPHPDVREKMEFMDDEHGRDGPWLRLGNFSSWSKTASRATSCVGVCWAYVTLSSSEIFQGKDSANVHWAERKVKKACWINSISDTTANFTCLGYGLMRWCMSRLNETRSEELLKAMLPTEHIYVPLI